MARHNGLVQAVVRQQVPGELPFEEALQAGRIGLGRAILGFDPAQGAAFSTYAWTCIKRHVWRAVKAHERLEADSRFPTYFCLPYIRCSAWQQSYQVHDPLPAARF